MSEASPVRIAICCLLASWMLPLFSGEAAPLPRPVLGKEFVQRLLAPETRPDAFYELILRGEENGNESVARWKPLPRAVFDAAMRDIRVTECPGRDGAPPLYLVTYKEDFEIWYAAAHPAKAASMSGIDAADLYPPAPQEAARRLVATAQKGTAHLDPQGLRAPLFAPELDAKVLIFIDSNGQVQWPHGGNNMGGIGAVIADLNGDGVLERMDSTRYGFDEPGDRRTCFQVLDVKTIEPAPRVLLAVVFNWHPESEDAANRWGYRVTPGEPLPVIELGPQPGERDGGPLAKVAVQYRWDQAAKAYTGPDGKKGDHFRRLDVQTLNDLWPKVQELHKEKSLGYPLLPKAPVAGAEAPAQPSLFPGAWQSWPAYQHHTLAGLSDAELFRWQYGGEPGRDSFALAFAPVVIPPKLRGLPPRDAALALAEANRTRAHREQFDLVLADEKTPILKEGVLKLEVNAGMGIPYDEFVRLNAERAEWWRCSGRDCSKWSHFVDESGTLAWLAETVAWLDRVRTIPRKPAPIEYDLRTWFCDATQVGLVWLAEASDKPVVEFRRIEPQFTGRQWKGPYTRLEAQTLAVNLWMHFSFEKKGRPVPVAEAVNALVPEKPGHVSPAQAVMISPAVKAVGEANLHSLRPRLKALEKSDLSGEPFRATVEAALNELDHRDDVPLLKKWAADFHRPEYWWARSRLEALDAAAKPSPTPVPGPPIPRSGLAATPSPTPAATWEQLAEKYRGSFAQVSGGSLEPLLESKGDHRRELWELMRRKFDGAQGNFREELAAAYRADLRDFASGDLAHLATASPDEAEGTRFHCLGGVFGGKPVDGRFHMARHILAVWLEPDALTRAKLLLLLGLNDADERYRFSGNFSDKLEQDLRASAAALQPGERARLIAFAQWCATDAPGTMDDYRYSKVQAQWLENFIQETPAGN